MPEDAEVYAIQRAGSGWRLTRRDLAAAVALSHGAAAAPQRLQSAAGYAHKGVIRALAIAPDGRTLVSASNQRQIRIWSLPEGRMLKALESQTQNLSSVAVSPDGKLLIPGCQDRTIQLWSLPDGVRQGYLVDPAANAGPNDSVEYKSRNASGQTVTSTQPCGTPIPPGAICTCNCVPGRASSGTAHTEEHCTCVPVHYWYPN